MFGPGTNVWPDQTRELNSEPLEKIAQGIPRRAAERREWNRNTRLDLDGKRNILMFAIKLSRQWTNIDSLSWPTIRFNKYPPINRSTPPSLPPSLSHTYPHSSLHENLPKQCQNYLRVLAYIFVRSFILCYLHSLLWTFATFAFH